MNVSNNKWVPLNADDYIEWKAWQCGVCGEITRLDEYVKKMPYLYCPHCGFKIRNGGENDE